MSSELSSSTLLHLSLEELQAGVRLDAETDLGQVLIELLPERLVGKPVGSRNL